MFRATPRTSIEIKGHYRRKTRDFAPMPSAIADPAGSMRFYAPVRLGPKTSETKEGFLICHDVPIARLGEMIYMPGEIENVEAGPDNRIHVTRDASALFRAETIASFEGKPITNDHPDDDVTPETWAQLSKGHMMNVRPGDGANADLLLADLLVMDKGAIADIHSGKREVSLGYDAHYEQVEPGRGVQSEILGNHIALVSRGRCGPVCAIRDRRPTMAKPTLKEIIQRAFKAKDAAELDTITRDAEGMETATGQEIHVHNYGPAQTTDKTKDETAEEKEAREKKEAEAEKTSDSAKIMDAIKSLADRMDNFEKGETNDGKGLLDEEGAEKKDEKTKDAAGKSKTFDAAPLYSDVVSRAEILAPGVKMPKLTKDAAADPKKTVDGLCMIRRRALAAGSKVEASKDAISRMMGGRTLDSLTCDTVESVFVGASELVRAANNSGKTRTADAETVQTQDAFVRGGLDKINKAFWDKQRNPL